MWSGEKPASMKPLTRSRRALSNTSDGAPEWARQSPATMIAAQLEKGLDWAADQGARVVNMRFAGPSDPRLHDALAKAYKRGMVLLAAAGNAGPNSPPLYPGADPNVIAVTATDSRDALFPGANRGNYIAVAAPDIKTFR